MYLLLHILICFYLLDYLFQQNDTSFFNSFSSQKRKLRKKDAGASARLYGLHLLRRPCQGLAPSGYFIVLYEYLL